MSTFNAYRKNSNATSSRSSSISDDSGKDIKGNMRESRLIQPEQWQLPEIQQVFEKVKNLKFFALQK
jgi:hypothetical protein